MQQQPSDSGQDNGRLMLGVGGFLFIPIAASAVWYVCLVLPRPQGAFAWGVRIFLEELAISAMLFFSVGFLWAVSGSTRLKRLLDMAAHKFAWLLIPLAIPAFVAVAYVLIFG